MKNFKRVLLGLVLAFVTVITLASCSKVSQSYADKINDAAKDNSCIAYADAKDALGDECFDVTVTVLNSTNGVLYAIKGFKNTMTSDEIQAKLDESDENTKYEAIVIVVLNNNCQSATYVSGTAAEIEAAITGASK